MADAVAWSQANREYLGVAFAAVYCNGGKLKTDSKLNKTIVDEWENLLIDQLCEHIESMLRRFLACVKADRAKHQYWLFLCSSVETGEFVKVILLLHSVVP